eukprot:jgi/Bigna1/69294/fgenesh1_pg.8_\
MYEVVALTRRQQQQSKHPCSPTGNMRAKLRVSCQVEETSSAMMPPGDAAAAASEVSLTSSRQQDQQMQQRSLSPQQKTTPVGKRRGQGREEVEYSGTPRKTSPSSSSPQSSYRRRRKIFFPNPRCINQFIANARDVERLLAFAKDNEDKLTGLLMNTVNWVTVLHRIGKIEPQLVRRRGDGRETIAWICKHIEDNIPSIEIQGLANTYYSLARIGGEGGGGGKGREGEEIVVGKEGLRLSNTDRSNSQVNPDGDSGCDGEIKTPQIKPQHLSNILWAMAKLRAQDGGGISLPSSLSSSSSSLLDDLETLSADMMGEFESQSISNSLWAFAKLSRVPGRLYLEAAYRRILDLKDIEPQHVANILHSLASLDIRAPQSVLLYLAQQLVSTTTTTMMKTVATRTAPGGSSSMQEEPKAEVGRRPLRLQSLSNALWALARITTMTRRRGDDGVGHYNDSSDVGLHGEQQNASSKWRETIAAIEEKEISNTLWGMASLRWRPSASTISAIEGYIISSMSFENEHVVLSSSSPRSRAAADNKNNNQRQLQSKGEMRIKNNNPDALFLSNIIWAYAKLRVQPSPQLANSLLAWVLDATAQGASQMGPQMISNSLWGISILSTAPTSSSSSSLTSFLMSPGPNLLKALDRRVAQLLPEFKSQEISNVMLAYGRMTYFPKVKRYKFLTQNWVGIYVIWGDPSEMSNIVWALSRWGRQHTLSESAAQALYSTLHQRANELETKGVTTVSWGLASMSHRSASHPPPPPEVLAAVFNRMYALAPKFTPKQVMIGISSLARLKQQAAVETSMLIHGLSVILSPRSSTTTSIISRHLGLQSRIEQLTLIQLLLQLDGDNKQREQQQQQQQEHSSSFSSPSDTTNSPDNYREKILLFSLPTIINTMWSFARLQLKPSRDFKEAAEALVARVIHLLEVKEIVSLLRSFTVLHPEALGRLLPLMESQLLYLEEGGGREELAGRRRGVGGSSNNNVGKSTLSPNDVTAWLQACAELPTPQPPATATLRILGQTLLASTQAPPNVKVTRLLEACVRLRERLDGQEKRMMFNQLFEDAGFWSFVEKRPHALLHKVNNGENFAPVPKICWFLTCISRKIEEGTHRAKSSNTDSAAAAQALALEGVGVPFRMARAYQRLGVTPSSPALKQLLQQQQIQGEASSETTHHSEIELWMME